MIKNIIIAALIICLAIVVFNTCSNKKESIDTTTWQKTNDSLKSEIKSTNDTVVYYKTKSDSFQLLWMKSLAKRPEIKIRYEKMVDSVRDLPVDERLRVFSKLLSEANSN